MFLEQRFQATQAIATEVVDGELVLLQLDDGVYFGLDPLGTQIWHWLVAGHSLRQIATELGQLYPSQAFDTLELDVQSLVNELVGANLVVPATSGS
jgi:Coenzyme PQQ synthesis protein D (PqqD)